MKPSIENVYEFYGLRIVGGDRGGWRKATCPLPAHEDNNPSASVNTDEGLWRCHACAEGGDAFDVVKEREGVTRWADLKRRTFEIAGSDGSSVQPERQRSSLLPGGPRPRAERRVFRPPWSSL